MAKVSGAALVAKALKREGVECVFTLTGGHISAIYYACKEEGIKVVDMRHENSTGYAASAYTQATGHPGVMITTAGPGIAHTVAAMEEARMQGIALVHFGGGSPTSEDDTGTLQDMNSLEVMSSCCKWAREIQLVERIPEFVGMAFRQAMDDFAGPAYLHVPIDILSTEIEEEKVNFPKKYRTDALPFGEPELIDKAADLLIAAKKPMIVVGDQARFSARYGEAIAKLADYLNMPVGVVNGSRGWFANEEENPSFTMMPAASAADVIVLLVTSNDFWMNKCQPPQFNKDAKFIFVNPDITKIGLNVPAEIGIVGGAGPVAKQLFEAVKSKTPKKSDNSWMTEANKIVQKVAEPWIKGFTSNEVPAHPGRCAYEVAKFLNEEGKDWNIVLDGGDSTMWGMCAVTVRRPGQLYMMGLNGTLGVGPGSVVGSWMANNKPVLYYSGDGSFGFYTMEFDTFVKQGIPVVCVISNDSGWGFIKHTEEKMFKKEIAKHGFCGSELEYLRRYDKLPLIWDGYGELVKDPNEIIPAIKRGVASGKPSIINVEVDRVSASPVIIQFLEFLGLA